MYDLELIPEARDDLEELDKTIAQRILNKLHWLTENFDANTGATYRRLERVVQTTNR